MKRLLAICCYCLGLLLSLPAMAAEKPLPTELAPLLSELTEARLSKAIPVLDALEAEGGEAVQPLFSYMLEGDLYYIKSSRQVIAVSEAAGQETFIDMLSGAELTPLSSREIKKIRVNNRLRGHLRDAIARLQLGSESASVRESAVRSLLSDLDDGTLEAIRDARLNEPSSAVRDVMDMALALHRLNTAGLAVDRIEAIGQLEGSLEGDVRNALNRVAERDPSPQVQQAAFRALTGIEQKVEFYAFVDQLFFGLSLGSVLLLAAIGLAITFGVMGVINMAHGEMIMLGAYTTYVVQLLMPNFIEYSLWVAVPAAFVVSGLAGVLLERLVIRHLHGRPLETLLATFGVSLILQQLVRTVFSPLNRQVASPEWMSGSWEINPVLSLTLNRLYILAFALLVFFALMLLLKKSSLGLNVRAVSQNRAMAKSMGIPTGRVDAMTFGLGSGIAGIAGVALSQLTNVGPNLGQSYIIDSFMVVVFGGVGNLWGTLVAAFSLGIANKFLEPVTGAVLASILVLVFIILFIQKRPKGLFPQKGRAAE
ncbi:urea ABC transporter permease subunit UrtB [Marinobacterium sp. AK62]|uniref:Urea ABC transporter permease subunit UrtB n=1 Tax=Marinobacterium alkalitolerans TaxID=1542925 RepID=A0ABS3ZBK3_9GAMM|nr:urea ABC transporter permease subunit UrtB [Marinobacterium alkalitolerans]MBP0049076.1 urea ABC transporter permease subunit UrtB [Marinobacterium alkalitolerans]